MGKQQNRASKAEVQTTKLNKMPVPNENDTEFSAEEAAKAFEQNSVTVDGETELENNRALKNFK
ncbi:hypothetical protein [Gorillibacterium massiliense]|uniref:hypothetical protein n=1 Tax=Gorillibacterium massiliense TaxID=1280390 RepID=UPI0004AC90A6|nr:hypothetical protein [Gorillibacterium massiliense]